jgi:uncharacterized protein YecE (DUF72 family)
MLRIGTSGWRYPNWRGDFYPAGLPQRQELAYLARHMNSVEINGSFYSLQTPQRYARWRDETPDDFVFAVKGGRYITHLKRLQDPVPGLANFFASGPLALGAKLGPFLWQLPATLAFDEDLVRTFLDALPKTAAEPDALAATATRGAENRPAVQPTGLRHALEPRHPSWSHAVPLLREYNVALVCADTAGEFPQFDETTADFSYYRLHGPDRLYRGSYRPDLIEAWAQRIREPAYVYFDNDADGAAPWDAMALTSRRAA